MAIALDVASVLAFVVIGRASHHHGDDVEGVASTAWPFLAGVALGWALLAARLGARGEGSGGTGRSPMSLRSGALVCVSTVAAGMVLRVLAGQGTAASFVGVSTGFLGACMLGGRAAVRALVRRVSPQARRG